MKNEQKSSESIRKLSPKPPNSLGQNGSKSYQNSIENLKISTPIVKDEGKGEKKERKR